jgi:regulator of protease activity HflC (stomatin/prohibitin superfamily)
MNVFRDKTSLHMTHELWPLIQKSLNESEFFILMASPEAAESEWVQMEIGEWMKIKSDSLDKFLIVLTSGQLQWDRIRSDFDWNQTTALSPMLKGKFKNEPLYLDFKWARDENDLSLRNPMFLDSVATVSATLQGRPKADMIGVDVKNHRIYKMIVAAAVSFLALSVGALSMSVYAFQQRSVALTQRERAESQTGEAVKQRGMAEEQRRNADEQKGLAERQSEEADHQRELANRQRKEAEVQRAEAQRQRQRAQEAEKRSTLERAKFAMDMELMRRQLRKCQGQ